ncbi:MAG: hypothetical protein HQL76_02050 [Magnetococcales bacterium]|nr:hypothetical protein [Magnetococcales bacterium]
MAGNLNPLREDLDLHSGPVNADGSPSWTIHDPVCHRFHRIGWESFEILLRWSLGDPRRIATAIRAETTLDTTPATVLDLERFLRQYHLLQPQSDSERQRWIQEARNNHHANIKDFVSRLLFFRIALVHPDRWLQRLVPRISRLFSRPVLGSIAAATCVGLILTLQRWELFTAAFSGFLTPSGLAHSAFALVIAKSVHELGHAIVARHFGCRVTTMGIAFITLWPVLYTETNDTWKLPEKNKRLLVAAAGILTELGVAGLALFSWHFLPEGTIKDSAFLLATTAWIWTLLINLNPFMRFDGYFILCDLLNFPNLHQRSFAFGRWWLREAVLGLGLPPPHPQPVTVRRFLILFSLMTWIYRTTLYVAVALFIYHLLFKLLGLIVFLWEMHHFIVTPIFREIRVWSSLPRTRTHNGHALMSGMLLLVMVALLFVPWHENLHAPAIVRAKRHAVFHAPEAGRLEQRPITLGQKVEQGALLVRLSAPERIHEARSLDLAIERITWQLNAPGIRRLQLEGEPSLHQQLRFRQAQVLALKEKFRRLNVIAPFPGEVVSLAPHLNPGDWIAEHEILLTLADRSQGIIEAVLPAGGPEPPPGTPGMFIPEAGDQPPRTCRLADVDRTSLQTLPDPMLASIHGGPVVVRVTAQGLPIPQDTLFRATCLPEDLTLPVPRIVRGALVFQRPGEAPMVRLGRWLLALLLRESGF